MIINFSCGDKVFQFNSPNHARAHEWMNGNKGADALSVYPRMFAHLRTTPKDGVIVHISSYYYLKSDGSFGVYSGGDINLTSYLPSTAGYSKLVFVSLDTNTNALVVTPGVEGFHDAEHPLNIPILANTSYIPSALIRLTYNMLEIKELHITDVRQMISHGTGSGSSEAVDINYDNSTSGISADNVQDALDEIISDFTSVWPGYKEIHHIDGTSGNLTVYTDLAAAAAAATGTGDVLLLGTGRHDVVSTITFSSNGIFLIGTGKDATIINVLGITDEVGLEGANLSISNLTIAHSTTYVGEATACDFSGGSGTTHLENVRIEADNDNSGGSSSVIALSVNNGVCYNIEIVAVTEGGGTNIGYNGLGTNYIYSGLIDTDGGTDVYSVIGTITLSGTVLVDKTTAVSSGSIQGFWTTENESAIFLPTDGHINSDERSSAPTTPSTGRWGLYPKSDGWYQIDDAGVETLLASGGYPFNALTVDFADVDADYATVTAAEAAIGSGGTIKIGPGSNDEGGLNINIPCKIIGQGIDITTITSDGSDYIAIGVSDATVTLENLTAWSTGSFVSVCQGVSINSSSNVTLRHVKGLAQASGTTASGILCAGTGTHTLDYCEGYGHTGTTRYGLYVNTGCTVVVTGGYYYGPSGSIYNNGGTVILRGPMLSHAPIGTWSGYYFDSNGDLHIDNDESSIKSRVCNFFNTAITDHFDGSSFAGLSWASYTGYVTPAGIDMSTFPSHVNIYLSGGQTVPSESFAYASASGKSNIRGRCTAYANCRAGFRWDNGTNTKYVMLFLEHNTSTNLLDLKWETDLAGPTTLVSGLPPTMYELQFPFNGTAGSFYYSMDGGIQYLFVGSAATTFTASRVGLYYSQRSSLNNSARSGAWDWYRTI